MSKDEVRRTEDSAPVYESPNGLGYRGRLLESDCMIYYEFDDQGLARAAYMIDHEDDGRDIVDYNRLKTLLTTKYGQPGEDEMRLTANVYRLPKTKETIDLERAVAEGAVHLKTWWQTPDTSIGLACRGVRGNAQVAVMYNSVEAKKRKEKMPDEANLELL